MTRANQIDLHDFRALCALSLSGLKEPIFEVRHFKTDCYTFKPNKGVSKDTTKGI